MALVKLKLPPLSNWLVRSGVQRGAEIGGAEQDEIAAAHAPPLPLKESPVVEIEAEPMTGVAVTTTEMVPPEFNWAVFQPRPDTEGRKNQIGERTAVVRRAKKFEGVAGSECDGTADDERAAVREDAGNFQDGIGQRRMLDLGGDGAAGEQQGVAEG